MFTLQSIGVEPALAYLKEQDPKTTRYSSHAFDQIVAFVVLEHMLQSTQLQYTIKEGVLVDWDDDEVKDDR
jgi:hypothetical protein